MVGDNSNYSCSRDSQKNNIFFYVITVYVVPVVKKLFDYVT